jgi:methionine aminopeptidase
VLAAEIEYAMRLAGSDYCSIPTEMTSGPRSVFGHGTPIDRALESGDLLHLEVGGVERRYNCVAMQTLLVPGARPKPAARDLCDVALRCLRAGLRQLRPSVPAAEVEEPALEIIRRAGLGDAFKMRFGYGVGIGYPPSWLEQLQITRTSTDARRRDDLRPARLLAGRARAHRCSGRWNLCDHRRGLRAAVGRGRRGTCLGRSRLLGTGMPNPRPNSG